MKPLTFHYSDSFLWVRVFGYGIKAKDVRKHPLLFSERYGKSKGVHIGYWRIGLLKREKG